MKQLIAVTIAAVFATAPLAPAAFAADAKKKPTAAQCKKDPNIDGCEAMKKDKK